MPGTLFVVATPIGNLEDISARALRVLRDVQLIAAEDTRRTAKLLSHYAIATPTTSLHEHNERVKATSLVEQLKRGQSIALVSDAGTPIISDPGQRLVQQAIDAGIRIESIPGPSAAIAALVVSGLPADRFTFLGFPPVRGKARKQWFQSLKEMSGTVVLFESPHRINRTLEQLLETVGDCRVCLARELTKIHEELVRGRISVVLQQLTHPQGEFIVVANLGHMGDVEPLLEPASDRDLLNELGHLVECEGLGRHEAIAQLAKKHARARNDIYKALLRARELV